MDLYTLDSGFIKDKTIDAFETLIWTERYNAFGDAKLTIPVNSQFKNDLIEGKFLSIAESKEVMLIDTVSDEGNVRTILAQSLVSIFLQRIFRNTWSTARSDYTTTGTAAAIAWVMVNAAVGAGGLMATDNIVPGTGTGAYEVLAHLIQGTPATGPTVTVAVPYGNLYDAVKQVCDADSVGFTLYPDNIVTGNYDLVFSVYDGLDRTSFQGVNAPVIFSSALDSLTDIKELRSIAGYKTAVYVWAKGVTARTYIGAAYAAGTTALTGFGRRTMMVDATDINAADYTATALQVVLNRRAKNELINNNYVRMTDGKIVPQNSAFVYGVDYKLGDIIELRAADNVGQKARIAEYIRTQDPNGETSYPSLSVVD